MNLPPGYFKAAELEARKIFKIKEERRNLWAKAPIHEKIRDLIRLQEIAVGIKPELKKLGIIPWRLKSE
jgi:hypothetical protein